MTCSNNDLLLQGPSQPVTTEQDIPVSTGKSTAPFPSLSGTRGLAGGRGDACGPRQPGPVSSPSDFCFCPGSAHPARSPARDISDGVNPSSRAGPCNEPRLLPLHRPDNRSGHFFWPFSCTSSQGCSITWEIPIPSAPRVFRSSCPRPGTGCRAAPC